MVRSTEGECDWVGTFYLLHACRGTLILDAARLDLSRAQRGRG